MLSKSAMMCALLCAFQNQLSCALPAMCFSKNISCAMLPSYVLSKDQTRYVALLSGYLLSAICFQKISHDVLRTIQYNADIKK